MDRCLIAIQVFDKGLDAAFVLKNILLFIALIDETNSHTGIEKRQLAQASCQNLIVELDVGECAVARLEAQCRTGSLRITDDL